VTPYCRSVMFGDSSFPVVDFEIAIGSDLQIAGLVELQRESTGVGENIFLVKRECYLLGLL
jgi:hypothetical protein